MTGATRPLLLLDVDGVLNLASAADPPSRSTEHDLFPGEEPVRLDPVHGAWITEVTAAVDVAWATAWNDDANRLLAPLLGIAPLPVVTMPTPPFAAADKVPPIAAHARARPAAWIDDVHPAEARAWAQRRALPTLLITVDPAVGLTRGAIDRLLAWAASLR